MKILLEGTPEQIDNLKAILANGDYNLPTVDEDHFIGNLWCVQDVQSKFKCDNKTALEILEGALTSSATMEQIWFAIGEYGDMEGLEEADEEDGENDLFGTPFLHPHDLRNLINKWQPKMNEGMEYSDTEEMLKEFEQIGYTFDYGLDGVPYDLRPLND